MTKEVINIHDKFNRAMFSDIKFAAVFLSTFLPESVLAKIDLTSLELSPSNFISEQLREAFADVVFNCNLKNTSEQIIISILIEHKSYRDKYTAVQLLTYLASAYASQLKSDKGLRPIVPVVFYHGKDPWQLKPVPNLIPNLPEECRPFIPIFDTVFVDLVRLSDEELHNITNTFLFSALIMQKYSSDPDYLVKQVNRIFGTLNPAGDGNLLQPIIVYFLELVEIEKSEVSKIIELIPTTLRKNFMSTYDKIEQDGIKKGLEQGIEQGLEQGLEQGKIGVVLRGFGNGLSIDMLANITSLTVAKVEAIIKKHGTK